MANAGDIKLDDNTSFLLVGDGGTHKTWFLGTCPQPSYTFDLDNGFAIHAGRKDMDYDLYKEVSRGEKPTKWQEKAGWYEYGKAYPAILAKINEIGRSIDTDTNRYKSINVDSLTLLTDVLQSYILSENKRKAMEIQDWGAFLSNMSNLFGQLSAWPMVKVLTAHIKRDDNLILGTTEQLPNVPGQFAGKVAVLFDEVYYTTSKAETVKETGKPDRKVNKFSFYTSQEGVRKQAKSRKYNLPDGVETDFRAIMQYVNARKKNAPAAA